MQLPFYWIDAFTGSSVLRESRGCCAARDMARRSLATADCFRKWLAETAFFVRRSDARYDLRWFTPTVEIDLCGHATLAAAFVLFSRLKQPGSSVHFETHSGTLAVTRNPGAA